MVIKMIVNKKYNISNKLNKKIVLLSDIHYDNKKDIKNLCKILNKINKIKPNYICITGDTLNSYSVDDFNLLLNWLKDLADISKVIMILGNHEYYYDKKNKIYKLNLKNINKINQIDNLVFLDNKNIVFDDINFIGLNLPIDYYMEHKENIEEFKKYIKDIKIADDCYNVLLCHTPINLSNKNVLDKLNVNLILCGHMHGGIVPRIFRLFIKHAGFISPNKKLFPKNVYGNIKINNKNLIITSGIRVLAINDSMLFRNIFSSEIVEINI